MTTDRRTLLTVAASAALLGAVTASRCVAASPALPPAHARPVMLTAADDDDAKGHDQDEDKDDEKGEKKQKKEVEQSVPMNMVPQAVIDAVMKECPGGKIGEAELEAKKGKIMWAFDVAVGDAKYDVKVTVDGKFYSKKVDADEKDDKADAKK